MRFRIENNAKTALGGCLVILASVFFGLLAFCASVLASAILVDALWHLGRWLLGW